MTTRTTLLTLMGILTMLGLAQARDPLAVGASAPELTATNQDGESITLADVYAAGPVLVYFYPKADTPGCTKQACSLRDGFAELQERGIQVIGVSVDPPQAQKKFIEKYKLPFILLADTDKKVVDAFGVPSTLGFASRQAFLIKDGEIIWRDLKASTAKQAADVLAVTESWPKS